MNVLQLRRLNILVLAGVCSVLLTALFFQLFVDSVLPCALCNLQRVGFLLYGIGLLINIRTRDLRGGYLLCFISSTLGSYVALLHILVEIPPGMPQVGSAIFGVHMYGWAFILFNLLTIYLVVARFLLTSVNTNLLGARNNNLVNFLSGLFLAIVAACLLSISLEVGLKPMGLPQHHYWVICKYQGKTDEECSQPTLSDIIAQYKQNRGYLDTAWPVK